MNSVALTREELGLADAVVIAPDHSAFDYQLIVNGSHLVVDTRNATKAVVEGRDKIIRA
ncbi:MAG: hypothetical protein HY270_05470 [Deltaproteobacteria bacterium]|nr:hypothetical protein [Deltaproteobacteria bacterium]